MQTKSILYTVHDSLLNLYRIYTKKKSRKNNYNTNYYDKRFESFGRI